MQCEFLELTNERNLLENENKGLTAQVSELKELCAQARKQLASERCQRMAAEHQAQAFATSKRSLEIMCEEAASEICVLRGEIETYKNSVGTEQQPCGVVEVCMCLAATFRCTATDGAIGQHGMQENPSASRSRVQEITSKAQDSQDQCRSIMLRVLNMLDPERVAPFASKALSDTGVYRKQCLSELAQMLLSALMGNMKRITVTFLFMKEPCNLACLMLPTFEPSGCG